MKKLEPLIDFKTNTSSMLLHKSNAEVCINGNIYRGEGEIHLELLPRATICAYGSFQEISAKDSEELNISSFKINNRKIDDFLLSPKINHDSGKQKLKWHVASEPIEGVGDKSSKISYIDFHLFNFVDFINSEVTKENDGTKKDNIKYVDLVCDEWHIELKSLISSHENSQLIKEVGGYQLTHIGRVRKKDNTLFSGQKARQFLEALRIFLSFAKGGWCEPICSVGFNESDMRVYELWNSPIEPWHKFKSWFDSRNSSQLEKFFPFFMNKWRDDEWKQDLHEIIYWYINANFSSRGIDVGIILSQAAIERLSYVYSVKYKKLIAMKGFKNLWASDKFRLLFSSLNIPIDIPEETPTILKLSEKFKWIDAPHALTEIRNSLVHPENKNQEDLASVYNEAWNLSLWYLEMGLLAVFNYSGTYGNRLKQRWKGQVENVPWYNCQICHSSGEQTAEPV
jgi:hypothetical protein